MIGVESLLQDLRIVRIAGLFALRAHRVSLCPGRPGPLSLTWMISICVALEALVYLSLKK